MRSQTRWSNACKAELQAQMIGLVAGRVQFLLFYTKISLETISVGPNFLGGSCPHTTLEGYTLLHYPPDQRENAAYGPGLKLSVCGRESVG